MRSDSGFIGGGLFKYDGINALFPEIIYFQASREQIYNQHYHWLLVGNQSKLEFYDLFGLFNISIDADVSYVKEQIQDNNDSVAYAVHDVYNNGKIIGGQLNVTGSHEMSCDPFVCRRTRHLSSLQKRSKYGNREQLTDVVLRGKTLLHIYKTFKFELFLSGNGCHPTSTHLVG